MDGYGVKVWDPNHPHDTSKVYTFQLYENQLEGLLQQAAAAIKLPTERDIKDKSKSNWISNIVVTFQILWFIAQLIGRAAQRLPTSTLELFTAGLVVCAIATHLAWLSKPQDVEELWILGEKNIFRKRIGRLRNLYQPTANSASIALPNLKLGQPHVVEKWRVVLCSSLPLHHRTLWSPALTGMGF
jgi:hypothetical protein